MIAAIVFNIGIGEIAYGEAADAPDNPGLDLPFKDLSSNDPNKIFITYIAQRGIISGFPDGNYHPREGLTRAQAAVVISKAAGLSTPEVSQSEFPDVKASHWAAASIAAASKAGYLKGFPDGNYHPEEKLTRAQGISLIMRLSKQKDQAVLPGLADMKKDHWAAADMGTALALEMIGLSQDGKNIYPDAVMSRGSLARALGTLLTKDPGLYQKDLAGTINEVKGEIRVTRAGSSSLLQNDAPVYKGDTITAGAGASASIVYPDGSSVFIKENTELYIKESLGRACIKQDGSSGIAVDNVDIELKKGTLFGALATKQENATQEKQQAQAGEILLASMDGLGYIADSPGSKNPPWYQQAEAKKVKMKIDMPYGVAAIRGTYILVSVNQDGSCNVSCLTGDAEVGGKSGSAVPLGGGKSSGINPGGSVEPPVPMTEKEKQEFSAVQQWVVNTALQIDRNKEATTSPAVEMIVEIPDQPATPAQQAEQLQNTIDVVLNALEASGIQLTEQVKNELEQKLKEMQQELSQQAQQTLQNSGSPSQSTGQPGSGGGGTSEESSVSYINYAVARTYGPESEAGPQIISKNVIVSAAGVTLQNMVITKDLILAAGIGSGSVTLKNVKVQGKTTILGGGPNSITVEDCELYTVLVDNQANTVKIVAKGSSKIGELTLNSGAKLEESELGGAGFSSVRTGTGIPAGATIILLGDFAMVNIDSPGLTIQVEGGSIEQMNIAAAADGTNLTLAAGVIVDTLEVNASATIGGAGQIISAAIKASGVVMQQLPQNWSVAEDIEASIGGINRSGGSSGSNAAAGSATATEGTYAIIYTLSTGTFDSVAGAVYANWTLAGSNAADLGAVSSVVLSAANTAATITVTNPIGTNTRVYTITPAQAALSAGFAAPAPATVTITQAPDITAPVFAETYPKAGPALAAGSKTVEILVKANESGTAYYVVVADGAPPPTAFQVMAGQNSTGVSALASAHAAVAAYTEKSFVTEALAADATAYDVYVVIKDGANNLTAAAKVDVTTPSPPDQSGSPAFTAGMPAKYGTELTVSTGTLGITTNLTFTWYRSDDANYDTGTDIQVATGTTYTPAENDIAKYLILVATSVNAAGNGTAATGAVAKTDGPAAPAAPTEAGKTDTSVTLTANALHQFSKDAGANWQDSEVFTGLEAETEYTFTARIKETAIANASAASAGTSIWTLTVEQQEAIDEVNAAAGSSNSITAGTLNAAIGEANAVETNKTAYQTAIEAAQANSLNTAAKIQMLVNTVNVAEAKALCLSNELNLICETPTATPTVALATPADLSEAGVTFAFTAKQDMEVSTNISASAAVITRGGNDGGTVLTVTITCASGGQTASDTIVYVVKVPSSIDNDAVTWGQPAPEPSGYAVAPGTANPGTPGGTSSVTYTSGYSLFYTLKPGFILPPIADEASSSYIEWLTPYSSGEDIIGAVYGNHLGLYEINTGNNHVVTFVDITLGANDIEAGAGGLAAPGITGFALEDNLPGDFIIITYTPAAGNTLRYVKQTSPFETPAVNAAAPAIGSNPGEATEYASGDSITINRNTDYIGLYEVNASSQVVRFVDVRFMRPT